MNGSFYEKARMSTWAGFFLLLAAVLVLSRQPVASGFPGPQDETSEKPEKKTPAPPGPSISIQSISGSTTLGLLEETLRFSPGEKGAGILAVGVGTYKAEDLLFLTFEYPADPAEKSRPRESSEIVLSNGDHFW